MKALLCLTAALACLAVAGCKTGQVNPASPRADTGYVDFYTDADEGLSWEVKETTEGGETRTVYAGYKELTGNVLRLAAPAGTHRFTIWFYNLVTTGPQAVVVQVENARVTPVRISLTPAGSTAVVTKSYEYRPTALASRRVSRVATDKQQTLQIGAIAANPTDYQPKERMPYFAGSAK